MISKRLVVSTFIGAVVMGAVAIGAPYLSGSRIEQQFNDSHQRFSQLDAKFEVLDYQRGWTASTARTLLTMSGPEERKIQIILDHQIEHGPTPGNPRLARIRSVPSFELMPELEADLKLAFGEQPLAQMITEVQLNGAQSVEIKSPTYQGPVGDEGVSLDWQGMNGTAQVSADMDESRSQLSAPRLRVTDPAGITLELTGLKLDWNANKPDGEAYWLGESKIAVARMNLVNAKPLEERRPDQPTKVELKDSYVKSLVRNSTSTLLSITLEMGSENLQVDDANFTQMRFDTAFNSISAETYGEMTTQLEEIQKSAQSEEEMMQLMMPMIFTVLPKFLQSSPEFELKQVGVKQQDSELLFKGSIRYVGEGNIMMFNPYQDIEANASLYADEIIVNSFGQKVLATKLKREMREQGQPMDEAMDAQMEQLAGQQLQMMLMQFEQGGFIKKDSGIYRSDLSFGQGKLEINGVDRSEMLM